MSASDSFEFSDYTILVDQDWKENRTKLIEAFNKSLYKEALLVIDDPKNKQIVEAFDVGCKLLVITRDSSLVESSLIYKVKFHYFLFRRISFINTLCPSVGLRSQRRGIYGINIQVYRPGCEQASG